MPFCAGGNNLNSFSEPCKSAESLHINNVITNKWVSAQMASQMNSTTFKEEIISILHNPSRNLKGRGGGLLLNSFYKTSMTPIAKLDKDITKKKTTG